MVSVYVRPLCVLRNGGVSNCYTGNGKQDQLKVVSLNSNGGL